MSEFFIIAETKNGKAFPHSALLFYKDGQYAQQVREENPHSDGAVDIDTDEQAAEFIKEKNASSVTFIRRKDAADWLDNEHPDSPVMRAMIWADWLAEAENEKTGKIVYSVAVE